MYLRAFAFMNERIICFMAPNGIFSQGTSVLSLDPSTGMLTWLGNFPAGIAYFTSVQGTSIESSYFVVNANYNGEWNILHTNLSSDAFNVERVALSYNVHGLSAVGSELYAFASPTGSFAEGTFFLHVNPVNGFLTQLGEITGVSSISSNGDATSCSNTSYFATNINSQLGANLLHVDISDGFSASLVPYVLGDQSAFGIAPFTSVPSVQGISCVHGQLYGYASPGGSSSWYFLKIDPATGAIDIMQQMNVYAWQSTMSGAHAAANKAYYALMKGSNGVDMVLVKAAPDGS